MDNSGQIAFWNGGGGASWVAAQARLDTLLRPLSNAALAAARVAPGEQVLDVGCGCGDTTVQLAARVARVVGVDVSAPMLERARERAAAQKVPAEFLQADAAQQHFDAQFDLLFSRFGVMFFADPVAAFANLRKALKPGGRLCFICWQPPAENPWLAVAGRVVQAYLPETETPLPRAPGPFAFADPDYVRGLLDTAGFTGITLAPATANLFLGATPDEALEFLAEIGPLRRVLDELSGSVRDEAVATVRAELAGFESSAGLSMGAACWIVTALRD